MTLTAEDMKDIVSEMKNRGYDVGVRDICYVLLCRVIDEQVYAYRAVFEAVQRAEPYASYSISDKVEDLKLLMDRNYPEEKPEEKHEVEEDDSKPKDGENLTFDEIKKGLEEDLASLVALRDQVDDDGVSVLPAKEMATVVGRIADIRTKLVERFGSSQENVEQRVVVMPKYSDICPYCNHEISIDPTHRKLI